MEEGVCGTGSLLVPQGKVVPYPRPGVVLEFLCKVCLCSTSMLVSNKGYKEELCVYVCVSGTFEINEER